jgi:flagellar protein FliO/FliZ
MRTFNRFCCLTVLCAASVAVAFAQATTTVPGNSPQAGNPPSVAIDETTLVLPEAPGPGGTAASTSIMPYFLRMIFVLGLVLAAIYGLYALLKRSARPAAPADTYLRVLASTTIASGKTLHVVSVGDAAWLVGATDSSIGLISEIKDKEIIDALALRAADAPQTPRKDFNSMLGELLGRKAGKAHTISDPSDFFSRQKDRLKKF